MKRIFQIIYNDNNKIIQGGRYCGSKPKYAAFKAFTYISKQLNKDDINFGLYEITKDSKNKKFWYNGKKEQLTKNGELYKLPENNINKEKLKELKCNKRSYVSEEIINELGLDKNVLEKIVFQNKNVIKKIGKEKCFHLLTENEMEVEKIRIKNKKK